MTSSRGPGASDAPYGIAYLAQADLPKGLTLPNTLRTRVRAIVSAVGLSTIVPVAPEVRTLTFLADSFEDIALTRLDAAQRRRRLGLDRRCRPRRPARASSRSSARPAPRTTASSSPGRSSRAASTRSGRDRPAGRHDDGLVVLRGRDATGSSVGPVTTLTPTQPATGEFEYVAGTYTVPTDGSIASLEVRCMSSTLVADKPGSTTSP